VLPKALLQPSRCPSQVGYRVTKSPIRLGSRTQPILLAKPLNVNNRIAHTLHNICKSLLDPAKVKQSGQQHNTGYHN